MVTLERIMLAVSGLMLLVLAATTFTVVPA
jgi:hypothetical protein